MTKLLKTYTRKACQEINVVSDIIIGKGKYSPPILTLMFVDNRHILVQGIKGKFPKQFKQDCIYGLDNDCRWSEIPEDVWDLFKKGISIRKQHPSHLDNYTFLYTYFLINGKSLTDYVI